MRLFFAIILSFVIHYSFAQGITIKEVKETVSGTDAFHAPIDSKGNPCGLVKVMSTIQDLTFKGEIVGDVENKTNEYHVFLAKGSRELTIARPHILPVKVSFAEYGIDEISSKATYTISLKDFSFNEKKNSTTINVTPKNAIVFIDEIMVPNENEDGLYQLLLPKGEHVIRIEAKGYRSSAQIVKSGKGMINLSVELESLMATLDVRCETSTAEIWIDNEMKGKGAWQGKVPAGIYMVTAKQNGYKSQTKEITIEEKGYSSFVLPKLERAMGRLMVSTTPSSGVLTIDGQGGFETDTPIDIKRGEHTIIVRLPFGYKDEKIEVDVDEEMIDTIKISMKPLNSTYAAAFDGDIDKQIQIRETINYYSDSIQFKYWTKRIYDEMLKMDDDSFLYYYDKMDCTTSNDNYNIECLLRKVKLDRGWSYPVEKGMVYSNIARSYESIENYQKAIEWGIKLCEMEPEYIYFKQLAQIYEKAGDKNNAILTWKKILGKEWDVNSWISVDLADAYYRLGYKAEAAKCYKDLLNNWDEGLYKDMKNEWRRKLKDMGY